MRIAYVDMFAGACGNMILGALIDCGYPVEELAGLAHRLLGDRVRVGAWKREVSGISTVHCVIECAEEEEHRHLSDILKIIHGSGLDPKVAGMGEGVFRALAEAEARVHGCSPEDVHFHEVGALDTIVDVMGSVAGFAFLKVDRVHLSPFHVGNGFIRCQHGIMPVPAPATAELIRGHSVVNRGVQGELTTPTGAAILTTLSAGRSGMPEMRVESTGYGCGDREGEYPNFLRIMMGEAGRHTSGRRGGRSHGAGSAGAGEFQGLAAGREWKDEEVAVLECNIDDMNPQDFGILFDDLYGAGAVEANVIATVSKKSRPGHLLTVLAPPPIAGDLAERIFRLSTTIGVRYAFQRRAALFRRNRVFSTSLGDVAVKVATMPDGSTRLFPEYEDVRRVVRETGLSTHEVRTTILPQIEEAWRSKNER